MCWILWFRSGVKNWKSLCLKKPHTDSNKKYGSIGSWDTALLPFCVQIRLAGTLACRPSGRTRSRGGERITRPPRLKLPSHKVRRFRVKSLSLCLSIFHKLMACCSELSCTGSCIYTLHLCPFCAKTDPPYTWRYMQFLWLDCSQILLTTCVYTDCYPITFFSTVP